MNTQDIHDGEIDPAVKEALDDVFGDTAVDQTTTWQHLENIIDECRALQEALDGADQNQ